MESIWSAWYLMHRPVRWPFPLEKAGDGKSRTETEYRVMAYRDIGFQMFSKVTDAQGILHSV
jgi:hypothetical protein